MNESIESICQMKKFKEDVYGVVFDIDQEYYQFDWLEEIEKYVWNRSLPNSNISSNQTNLKEMFTYPMASIDEFDNSKENSLDRKRQLRLLMFLSNLDPRRDIVLYNREVLHDFLTVSAYLVIILVSLFGNLLVLFIILSRRHLRAQTTNKLIANLTFSDLLLTMLNIPLTIVRLLFESWPLGSVFCHLGPLVQAMSVYVSTISMVVIAIDRHQVLLGSLPKRLSSTLPSIWTIVFIWILSTIFSMPHFVFNRVIHKQMHICVKRCQAIYPKPALTYSRAITIFTVLSQYLVPLAIIIICYTQIGIHIWKRVRIGAMTRSQKDSHLQARKRTIKMLILVVIVFAICWLPLNLYHIYLDFIPNSIYSKRIFIFCHWFGISSVCYNPFIYFWLNKQYKERARNILRMCFKWHCCQSRLEIDCDPSETCSSYENIPARTYHRNKQILVMKNISRTGSQKRSYSDSIENSFACSKS